MKIAIAHGNIMSCDAIGTDILGMHDVLAESGFEVSLVAERFDDATRARARTMSVNKAVAGEAPGLLIYHHSTYWERGEELVHEVPAMRLMKYHNVTPPEFYEDCSPDHMGSATAGRRQTLRLISMFGEADHFAADSAYDAAELVAAGAGEPRVVPPFTNVAQFVCRQRAGLPEPPFSLLFVGRRAPYEGHFDLLTIVAAYVAAYGPKITLTMVGAPDDPREEYAAQLRRQIGALGIGGRVRIVERADDEAMRRMFAEASVFVCMSEHEGFCVPIIEAQASGVPIVSTGAAALGETIGPGQLVVDPPRTKADYAFIARLIHAACTDAALRRQVVAAGHRNVLARFNPVAVADLFMETLSPMLERLA